MVGAAILWPIIALVALTFAVWLALFAARGSHMRATPPSAADFASGSAALAYFEPVEMPANNLRNLFEMPVLFYVVAGLLFATGLVGAVQPWLGWFYVLCRYGHSYEHVVGKRVIRRFRWYALSCAILLAMWIGFAIDLAGIT